MADDKISSEAVDITGQKKADFIKYLYAYLGINAVLWIVWWFMEGRYTGFATDAWPLWIMAGWGIGMALKYLDAWHGGKAKQEIAVTEKDQA